MALEYDVASNVVMTKSELIEKISSRFFFARVERVENVVNAILEDMGRHLENGGRIEVRNFGAFKVKHFALKNKRNPKNNKPVSDELIIRRVRFKPGKELAIRVNNKNKHS